MLIPGGFASPLRPVLDLTFTAPAETLDSRFTFTRASSGTRYNAAGLLVTAGTNAPRFDYDPLTLAPRGLLVEAVARTNELQRSEDFGNVYWVKNNVSVSSDATTAPDGNTTADKVVESASNDLHNIARIFSFTSGTTYTFSLFVKPDSRTVVALGAGNPATWAARAVFDLSAKTVSIANGTAKLEELQNGWFRCAVTGVAGATANTNITAFINSFTAYAGDGTSGLYVWGAQFEVGAFASSYIQTTTASATRAAEVCTMPNSTYPFSGNGGSVLVRSQKMAVETDTLYPRIFDIVGTTGNSIQCLWATSSSRLYMFVNDGGIEQTNIGRFGVAQADRHAVAMTWGNNNFGFCIDGGTDYTDNSGSVPTVSTLRIGTGLCGWIQELEYFPRQLSAQERQRISAP